MYQRQISRDKVHTIFSNSKLNVNVYTSYTPPPPGVYVEGCIVFVFPIVRSSFPMFVRLLVRLFVIPLINLSLLADADPARFDSDNGF